MDLGSILGWLLAPKPPGQIVPKATLRCTPSVIRCTLYAIPYKQPLGQIVPKTSSGTNRSKKKASQQILPTKPSPKKGAGRAPREAAQF